MMKKLLPRSLFSRLVLVLLSGLVIAQVLSLAIQLHERGQLLSHASGIQSAQRIADIVRVLEPLSPGERGKMVRILSAPRLLITLGGVGAPSKNADTARPTHAAVFEAMLRRFLGDAWSITVAVTDSPPWMPPAAMKDFNGPGMHEDMRSGPAMHAFAQPGFPSWRRCSCMTGHSSASTPDRHRRR